MAYTPQTWTDGDVTTPLTGARLTHIESGLATLDARTNQVDNTPDIQKPVSAAQAAYATSRAVALSIIFGG